MAIIYVDSNAAGLNDGTSFVNAFTTLNAASAVFVANDECYMAHNHSEVSAVTLSITLGNTSLADLMKITRVNSSTELYSPTNGSDTNAFDITGANSDLELRGAMSWTGVKFNVEDDIKFNFGGNNQFTDCHFTLFGSSGRFLLDDEIAFSRFLNCTFDFTHASGSFIQLDASPQLIGCTFLGNVVSAGLFQRNAAGRNIDMVCQGCDFSQLTHLSNGPLIGFAGAASRKFKVKLVNCRMKTAVPVGDAMTNDDQSYALEASDDGSNNDYNEKTTYRGTWSTNKLTYYLATDAYTDSDTATPLSHELVPVAEVGIASGLLGDKFLARLDTLGAATLTVQGLENFTTALTQRDCFLLVSYLGNGTTTQHQVDSQQETAKPTYTALAAGSGLGNWNAPPGSSRSIQLTAAITNTKIGLYSVQVVLHQYELGRSLLVNPVVTVT